MCSIIRNRELFIAFDDGILVSFRLLLYSFFLILYLVDGLKCVS